ncbi:uncharacterized protein LACBIDRAFT_321617 [Laccaria bicolor S238N-H82]|uniref:Predicted protein n=1 Tax=Laccaria bicolor (strain S238N-H82 / ATCC MYA-4686) TaxID=486041 RepID=B0CTJ8_LACBS|nr:uncharacterized protein LACBIDRAFT_321617 [Laccaria bicolor S238N-H82]EDR14502.1 predicted protein [Laccaria bicolor S238N-H82]|eukprot:XP_001875061.1 predicted protein [Laccaria bicolor S238N-H82]
MEATFIPLLTDQKGRDNENTLEKYQQGGGWVSHYRLADVVVKGEGRRASIGQVILVAYPHQLHQKATRVLVHSLSRVLVHSSSRALVVFSSHVAVGPWSCIVVVSDGNAHRVSSSSRVLVVFSFHVVVGPSSCIVVVSDGNEWVSSLSARRPMLFVSRRPTLFVSSFHIVVGSSWCRIVVVWSYSSRVVTALSSCGLVVIL